jgi:hypothetical protein
VRCEAPKGSVVPPADVLVDTETAARCVDTCVAAVIAVVEAAYIVIADVADLVTLSFAVTLRPATGDINDPDDLDITVLVL